MANILTYEEAKEIYDILNSNLDFSDEDYVFLYNRMVSNAVYYANIRAGWNALSREQKLNSDEGRTMAHNAFISSIGTIARLEGEIGAKWLARLSDDRKRIGDFACYIALFQAIDAR
ncbi:MAG: hypothetical protein Q4C61_12645 [Lachnospiraceae bacterium]|nr:hypothetical protein [Lachnospiraceae bacterium]